VSCASKLCEQRIRWIDADDAENIDNDENAIWQILSFNILNNDYIRFSVENIKTGQVVTDLKAGRQGWEWGIGEKLNLSEFGL